MCFSLFDSSSKPEIHRIRQRLFSDFIHKMHPAAKIYELPVRAEKIASSTQLRRSEAGSEDAGKNGESDHRPTKAIDALGGQEKR